MHFLYLSHGKLNNDDKNNKMNNNSTRKQKGAAGTRQTEKKIADTV